jgi:hypothetical protein
LDFINQLNSVNTEEISIVDRAANLKPKYLIVKRGDYPMTFEELVKALGEAPDGPEAPEKWDELLKSLAKAKMSDKATDAVKSALRLLLQKDVAGEIPASFKAAMANLLDIQAPAPVEKKDDTPPAPDAPADVKPDAKPEPGKGAEPVDKGISVEFQKKFDTLEKRNEELSKALDEEKQARRRQELIQKAEKEYSNVAGTAEEIADILMKAEKAGISEDIDGILAKYQGAAEEALKVAGSDRAERGGSALAKLQSIAEEIKKADPSLNDITAFNKALENNPGLYDEYNKEVN